MKVKLRGYHSRMFTDQQRSEMTRILVKMEQDYGISITYNLTEREQNEIYRRVTLPGLWEKLKIWVSNTVHRRKADDYINKFLDFQLFCWHELKEGDANIVLATFTQKQLQEALDTRYMMDWYEAEKAAGRVFTKVKPWAKLPATNPENCRDCEDGTEVTPKNEEDCST